MDITIISDSPLLEHDISMLQTMTRLGKDSLKSEQETKDELNWRLKA